MKIRQVVEVGNVESTYVWSNSIEFNVEGGEVKPNLTNDRLLLTYIQQMIKLHKRLTERVESIRKEDEAASAG